jgi:FkbM family methyltransferase
VGHVQHKYTRAYFTKIKPDGSVAEYGVEGYEEFMGGNIRYIDLAILNRINFTGCRVMEFGFGRGEAIKYALEHGAAFYEGVDFSEHAIAIASEFLRKYNLPIPPLHHADALTYLKGYKTIHDAEKRPAFDIVLMLDFIEHVPRAELMEIMTLLRGTLSETAVIVINTPAFRVDNDVIHDGIHTEAIDTSDVLEETAGMHCNKYTVISLKEFMGSCGFNAISEAHFYIPNRAERPSLEKIPSFRQSWESAIVAGCPLSADWSEDVVEYAYQTQAAPHWHSFNEGRLIGIMLLITHSYQLFFPKGEYDSELFDDIDQQTVEGKTIFDVGGFMGVSALLFARQVGSSGRILCFEPNPWNQERIRSNLSHNPELATRISLFGLALGDYIGKMEMLLSDNVDTGYSSTSQSVTSHGTLPKGQLVSLGFHNQTVALSTLDAFVQTTGIIPHILKVDIEGVEHLFLAGAEDTIRVHRPIIYMEVHSPFCAWQCSHKLQRLGYVSRLLLEENDGRIMIKAEPQETSLKLEDSPALSRELFDLLRLERQRQIQSAQNLHSTQQELHRTQRELHSTQKELHSTQKELHSTQKELHSTQQEFEITKHELNILIFTTDRMLRNPFLYIKRFIRCRLN